MNPDCEPVCAALEVIPLSLFPIEIIIIIIMNNRCGGEMEYATIC